MALSKIVYDEQTTHLRGNRWRISARFRLPTNRSETNNRMTLERCRVLLGSKRVPIFAYGKKRRKIQYLHTYTPLNQTCLGMQSIQIREPAKLV